MAPYTNGILRDEVDTNFNSSEKQEKKAEYKLDIVWRNVAVSIFLHTAALYGLFLMISGSCRWMTIAWVYFCLNLLGTGVTAGAHRLWAHRAYKANLPLRILLAFCQTASIQNHIYEWVRDHRVHHKFTDTDADPHNSTRGFFFSHMGWLLVKKHPDVMLKGRTVDLSDLEADPVVRFQRKHYVLLAPLACFVFPAWVPWYFWNEDLWVSFFVAAMFRYVFSLHGTWLVNSAAHMWGMRPYDKNISPVESPVVSALALGEGWHNYHHVFPWDYKVAELGNYGLNFTTAFIDFMAAIGWAYDLKTTPAKMIRQRMQRTGDGVEGRDDGENALESNAGHDASGEQLWGWDDKDMDDKDKERVELHCRKT